MTNPILPLLIADIRKNEAERIRVSLAEFHGAAVIDLRQWFLSRDDAEPRPTKKGLCVSIRHLPALAKALNEALESARKCGLLSEDG